jgi:hypothetical protein
MFKVVYSTSTKDADSKQFTFNSGNIHCNKNPAPKIVSHNVCGKISHHAKLPFRIVMLAHGLMDWILQLFLVESTVKAVV